MIIFNIMFFVIYILLAFVVIGYIFLMFKFFEYFYCACVRHQPPFVASPDLSRKLVVSEIIKNYPNAKNICEIGSGFGGLARAVARNTNANVYALENMPFSAFVSKLFDKISFCKNNKTIWCDAFEFLDNTDIKFDVAIAFLGPKLTPCIQKYTDKIKVLISLDFEIGCIKPTRIIEIGHGATIYQNIEYPHRLFVYEF